MNVDELVRQGLILHRQGRLDQALPLYQQALGIDPNHAEALNYVGLALSHAGQAQLAVQHLMRAVQIRPDYAAAYANLGNAWRRAGRPADALPCFERALRLDQRLIDAHVGYANALLELGRPEEALSSFDAALALEPGHAAAHCNRGAALQLLKRPAEAVRAYDRAIELAPDMAEAFANRGNALRQIGRHADAAASCDKALGLRPNYAVAFLFRGYALLELDRALDALADFDAALGVNPSDHRAMLARGRALHAVRRHDDAIACFDAVLARAPDEALAHFYRAVTLLEQLRRDEAFAAINVALTLDAAIPGAHHIRASLFAHRGAHELALVDFEREFSRNPDADYALGNLLNAKAVLCDWSGRDELVEALKARTARDERAAYPFVLLSVTDAGGLQRKCAEAHARAQKPFAPLTSVVRGAGAERVNLGYFSSDFCDHPVAHLMAEPFAAHDRTRFAVHAYSWATNPDVMTEVIKQRVDTFVDCRDWSAEQIAGHARAAGIDIAIDLNGYTNGARTVIFAARAAPIQVNYIGYVGSMSAPFIDYIVVDEHAAPKREREHYGEKLLCLPLYQVNAEPAPEATAVDRALYRLPEDAFVYCSFNSLFKLTPEMFALWMRILQRTQSSVLWMYAPDAAAKRNLAAEVAKRGVALERVIFADGLPRTQHLKRQRAADLALDTFPYNGGVTTSSALRAGVPVLTRAGEAFASRMGVSLLNAVGLGDLVTDSIEAYETKAVELASTPGRLSALRTALHSAHDSALFDVVGFTRNLEAGFDAVMRRHQLGQQPADIVV